MTAKKRRCRRCRGPMPPRRPGESRLIYANKKLCGRDCQVADAKAKISTSTGLGTKRSGEPRR